MKKIEVIVVNKYNATIVNEVYEVNYSDERAKKLCQLDGCFKLSDNNEKTSFIYKDNRFKGVILYRGFIKPFKTEDWLNKFSDK
ncbi:MAG: hypothetical protein J1E16_06470 [Muribaculaceae bacterium]|nr:hypothetical protein [Muribaculaceae bacterium]